MGPTAVAESVVAGEAVAAGGGEAGGGEAVEAGGGEAVEAGGGEAGGGEAGGGEAGGGEAVEAGGGEAVGAGGVVELLAPGAVATRIGPEGEGEGEPAFFLLKELPALLPLLPPLPLPLSESDTRFLFGCCGAPSVAFWGDGSKGSRGVRFLFPGVVG